MIKLIIPGEPVGKGRPRMSTRTGKAYTPQKTKQYEAAIRQAYHEQVHGERLQGALSLTMRAYFSIPKSSRKDEKKLMQQGKIRPTKKPDIDNIIKTVDALNAVAFDDDKQIVQVYAEKYYDFDPRLEIEIQEIRK